MEVASFAEIEAEFLERVHSVVWCSVATVDRRGRPRSRILHPIWDGATGWVITRRHSFKSSHLSRNPYVSLAYIADIAKPVYVDCAAEWVDDLAEKERISALFRTAPPPLGYDPAQIFARIDDPGFGLLKLTPWRIDVANVPGESRVWHKPDGK